MKLCLIVILVALAYSTPVAAQHIYKCAGGAYSQTPCADGKAPQKVYHYTPEPDSPPEPTYYVAQTVAAPPSYQPSLAAIRDPYKEGLNSPHSHGPAKPYSPPRFRSPADGIGQPANVIDPRTSMPINGAIKVAPNLIWDPTTGQYREAY